MTLDDVDFSLIHCDDTTMGYIRATVQKHLDSKNVGYRPDFVVVVWGYGVTCDRLDPFMSIRIDIDVYTDQGKLNVTLSDIIRLRGDRV